MITSMATVIQLHCYATTPLCSYQGHNQKHLYCQVGTRNLLWCFNGQSRTEGEQKHYRWTWVCGGRGAGKTYQYNIYNRDKLQFIVVD